MYGEANRLGARISEERHGAMHGYGCVAPPALYAGGCTAHASQVQ
jgi:hypothetical protein